MNQGLQVIDVDFESDVKMIPQDKGSMKSPFTETEMKSNLLISAEGYYWILT